jgi:TolB-like protein
MFLRCSAFFVLLVSMVAETVIAAPPSAPDTPGQDNTTAPAIESSDSLGASARPDVIGNVPSAGIKEKTEESEAGTSDQTKINMPSGEDEKRISSVTGRRSTKRHIHRRRGKGEKGKVFCDKTEDASGRAVIDCTDSPGEKQRKSYTRGYMILTPPESLIILPFKNASGQKELDWLSIGLWDIMSEKLGYVQGFRVVPIREYIKEARRPTGELVAYNHDRSMGLARDLSARQVWKGEFRKDAKGNIEIDLAGLNVKSGRELFHKKLTSSLGNLQFRIDGLIEEILSELDAGQKNNVVNKMKSKYVDTMKAWELNALGYEKQLLALLTGRGEKRDGLIEESIGLHQAAVEEAPKYAGGWSNLGWSLFEKGDIEGAKEAFKQSIKIKPFYIAANMGMGYALWEENNIADAVPFMKQAINQNPNIEWNRDDMKRTALRLNLTRNVRKKRHQMSGIQIIGP